MAHPNAIIVFSKAPHISRTGNSEPYASLPWDDVDKLFSAFIVDVLQQACRVQSTDVLYYRNSSEPMDEYLYPLRDKVTFCDAEGENFGEQVYAAVEKTFGEGYYRVIVVLDNNPTISSTFFERVFDQLTYEDDCVVFGPTIEGKCFLIGLKGDHSEIFDCTKGNPCEKEQILLERLCRLEGVLFPTQQRYLLDSGFNLARLKDELEAYIEPKDDFPERTFEVFKSFDKKYRLKYSLR